MPSLLDFVLVVLVMTVLDYVWAEYTKSVEARREVLAPTWSALLIVLSGYVAISYVHNNWLLIAAAVGAWIGTWLSLKFGSK